MRFHPFAVVFPSLLIAACGTAQLDDSRGDVPQAANEDSTTGELLGSNSADDAASLGIELRPGSFVIPRQVPVLGRSITSWTTSWFRWHFAVPADKNPILILNQDCATGQNDRVFFVPTFDGSDIFERTCRVPFRKPVLVSLWAVINDYPCPDPAFQPAPGQSLEDFLREGAVSYDDGVQNLAVTVDGDAVDPGDHRHTSRLFHFVGDPSLVGKMPDPCLLGGTRQPGVADGWWLMLLLAPGEHAVHVSGLRPEGTPFDARYRLKVDRR